tara:strand:- start:39 stop:479 length:441 start_codon:yes stop_codon:yes gene_type:complete
MTSYIDAIEVKKEHIDNYVCEQCNVTKYNVPWLNYDTDEKCICSYLCYKQKSKQENIWNKINNKEDFDLPRPVIKEKKKEFVFLSNDELMKLSDSQLNEYYNEMESYYFENPERANMLMNIMDETDNYDMSESEYTSEEDTYTESD